MMEKYRRRVQQASETCETFFRLAAITICEFEKRHNNDCAKCARKTMMKYGMHTIFE